MKQPAELVVRLLQVALLGLTVYGAWALQRTPGKVVGSFHPTSAGYQRLADVIAAQLRASPTQAPG